MSPPPALPADLLRALESLPADLRGGQAAGSVAGIVAALAALEPAAVASVPADIRQAAKLYRRDYGAASRTGWFALWRHGPRQLDKTPGLAWVYLFHGDGYLREAALHRIDEAAPGAFLVAAIAQRLNDWVGEVRVAARRCAVRIFPRTDPRHLADAAFFLLDRAPSWRRWGHGSEGLPASLVRGDVAPLLARSIAASAQGPMPRLLMRALRWPEIDSQLPMLARQAVQPAVRAAALDALVRGSARWPVGLERKWIDKSAGRWVAAPTMAERPLSLACDPLEILRAGAADRAALVRRTAAQALIGLGREDPAARALLERLAQDASRAVRERADFAVRDAGSPAP